MPQRCFPFAVQEFYWIFLIIIWSLGYTPQCSGLTPGSVLKGPSGMLGNTLGLEYQRDSTVGRALALNMADPGTIDPQHPFDLSSPARHDPRVPLFS